MSDRVTNIEIEDVLSSIRRLVMEGGSGSSAPVQRAAPPVSASEADNTASSKFVLTAALRVAEPAPLRAATPLPQAIWSADDPLPLDILPDARLPGGDDTLEVSGDHSASDFTEAEVEPIPTIVDAAFLDRRLRLADMAAGLEAAVTAQPDDWEPDGSESVPVMDWSRTTSEDAPVFRSRHAAPLRLEQPVPPAPPPAANDNPAFHHEAGPSGFEDDNDPDGIARFEAVAEEQVDDDLAAFIGGERVIDEEMLRNLVIEIVRQELQGTLGERITRNVRKLVRREIALAINNPDLE